jgi:hypothetical protein
VKALGGQTRCVGVDRDETVTIVETYGDDTIATGTDTKASLNDPGQKMREVGAHRRVL